VYDRRNPTRHEIAYENYDINDLTIFKQQNTIRRLLPKRGNNMNDLTILRQQNTIRRLLPTLVTDIIGEYLSNMYQFDLFMEKYDMYYHTFYRYYTASSFNYSHLQYVDGEEEFCLVDSGFEYCRLCSQKHCVCNILRTIERERIALFQFSHQSFKANLLEYVYNHKFTTFSSDELSELLEKIIQLRKNHHAFAKKYSDISYIKYTFYRDIGGNRKLVY